MFCYVGIVMVLCFYLFFLFDFEIEYLSYNIENIERKLEYGVYSGGNFRILNGR